MSFRESGSAGLRLPTDAMERDFADSVTQLAGDIPIRVKHSKKKVRREKTSLEGKMLLAGKKLVQSRGLTRRTLYLPKGMNQNSEGSTLFLVSPARYQDDVFAFSVTHDFLSDWVGHLHSSWQTFGQAALMLWGESHFVLHEHVSQDGSFLPSVELTDFWIRGLKRRLRKARAEIENSNIKLSADSLEARKELGGLIVKIISVIGYRHQHGVDDFSEFGREGRFEDSIIDQFINRVPISGDEATAFLNLLYSELLSHLRSGEVAGAWGFLSASGNDINMTAKLAEVELLSEDWKVAEILD